MTESHAFAQGHILIDFIIYLLIIIQSGENVIKKIKLIAGTIFTHSICRVRSPRQIQSVNIIVGVV